MTGLIHILDGKLAGTSIRACQFPFWVGRIAGVGLRLEEAGVWDRHLRICFDPVDGFSARIEGQALATLNGESFSGGPIRNGDVFGIGGVRLQFWLGAVQAGDFRLRECLTWAGLLALAVLQVIVVYWLAR